MKRRLFFITLSFCLVATLLLPLVHPTKAFADEQSDLQQGISSLAFADADNIVGTFGTLGQIDFVDVNTNSGDTTYNYTPTSGNFQDPGTVKDANGVSGGIRFGIDFTGTPDFSKSNVSGVIKLGYQQGTVTTAFLSKVTVSNPDVTGTTSPAATADYSWDNLNITAPSGASGNAIPFAPASQTAAPLYIQDNPASVIDGGCPAKAAILLDKQDGNTGTIYNLTSPSIGTKALPSSISGDFDPSKCEVSSSHSITITGTQGTALAAPGSTAGAAGGAGGEANSTEASCESGSTFSLNWIFCGIFDGLSSATNWVETSLVEPQLKSQPICVDPTGATCSTSDYGAQPNLIYKVWSNFRVYGDIMLVIFLLVAILGEAIGGGVIEAYTVRKVLPRLLAAAIMINLSIYIVALLVDMTNIIGGGIGQLLTQPLSGAQAFVIHPSGITSGSSVAAAGGIVALFLGASHIVSLFSIEGISMILSVIIIPALLALIAVFFTIAIRKAIILVLIFISPIAFALYCLPNTEKHFRRWWDLLLEMLMIYPIIVLLFAVGDIMSVTTQDAAAGSAISGILSLLFLVIPLLLIPVAFRLAGSSIARIHEAVTGARKQVNSMGQARRDRARQQYGGRVTTTRAGIWNSRILGGVRDETGGLARDPVTGAAIAPGLRGRLEQSRLAQRTGLAYGIGRRYENVNQQVVRQKAELDKDPRLAAVADDDDTLRAKTYSGYADAVEDMTKLFQRDEFGKLSAADARARAQRGARAAQESGGFGAAQAVWAAEKMAHTKTAIRDLRDQSEIIARASNGNNSTRAGLAGALNTINKQVGRHDLAPGFTTVSSLAAGEDARLRGGGTGPSTADYARAAEQAWQSGSLYQHANDTTDNIKSHIAHFSKQLNAVDASGAPDQAARERALIFFHELKTMSPNATGGVKEEADHALEANDAAINAALASLKNTPGPGSEVRDPTATPTFNPTTNRYERPIVAYTQETPVERIDRLSRSYDRTDPNLR